MKWTLAGLTIVGVIVSGWIAAAQDPPAAEHSFWMQKKLTFSQHLLAGIATEDFAQIIKSATSMNNLSEIEKWSRRTNAEEYRTQLRIFRFANQELVRQAEKKNIDGVALAYSQLTLSCVNCHKILRDTKE